jgi:CIC family chloride channel protein
VFVAINGTAPLFDVGGAPAFGFRDLAGAVLVGVVAGLGARLFALAIRLGKAWSSRPLAARLALAGPAVVASVLLGRAATGSDVVVGSGYEVVHWAGEHHATSALLAVLLLRCLCTAAVVAGGGVGGLFVPLVVAGILEGQLIGRAVHSLDDDLFGLVGVAAFLGAGYRVPLAAVMFVAESSGRPGFVVPGLLAAVAAELVVGDASVTAYQRRSGVVASPPMTG